MRLILIATVLLLALSACTLDTLTAPTATPMPTSGPTSSASSDEIGRVTRVIDGDTIDVNINGTVERVRYVGVNTPERDEPCYTDAINANAALVENQTVRLVRDVSNRDRFDRLLRYIYVGDVFVNESLVSDGWAEVARYEPDVAFFADFRELESDAEAAGLGCHPTGIFDDGTYNR